MTSDEGSPITWRELLEETARTLGERPAARWICETACGLDGQEFLDELDAPATERMVAHLDAMVQRYRHGEPLAYVMGRWSFRTIDVLVDPRALVPRPETEIVAERAIELARSRPAPRRIVDLGTGSGVIGLSLAVELPVSGTEIWMTDVSVEALDLARANVAGIGRAGANVRLAEGSWFAALPENLRGAVDMVVSNPPYIAVGDDEVHADVVEWEPHGALFAGGDGLDALRIIVADTPQWLAPAGWLIVEIGHRQGPDVSALMSDAGFTDVRVGRDLAGRDRYVEGRSR